MSHMGMKRISKYNRHKYYFLYSVCSQIIYLALSVSCSCLSLITCVLFIQKITIGGSTTFWDSGSEEDVKS